MTGTPDRKRLILTVLGMHRSGTSVITGALSKLGFNLGARLVPAAKDNPLGYFESAEAVDINECLLLDLERGWDDLRPFARNWLKGPAAKAARLRIDAWLEREVRVGERFVLKDPRLCLTFPLWRERFAAAGVDLRVLIAHRPFVEVAASLSNRDGLSIEHALLLALRYGLEMEAASRGLPRTVCTYGQLLEKPRRGLAQVLEDLGLPKSGAAALRSAAELFDGSHRHHHGGALQNVPDEIRQLCEAFERSLVSVNQPHEDADWAAMAKRCGRMLNEYAGRLQPEAGRILAIRRRHRTIEGYAQKLALGLSEAAGLAGRRLEEIKGLSQRVAAGEAALHEAERIAAERLTELGQLASRIRTDEAALAEVEQLAVSRLAELEGLSQRVAAGEAALHDAERIAAERLTELEGLSQRVAAGEAALHEAERIAAERQTELEQLASRIRSGEAALAEVEQLAVSRLAELEGLSQRVAAGEAARWAVESALADCQRKADLLGSELAEIRHSMSWRMTAPFRRVAEWWRRQG